MIWTAKVLEQTKSSIGQLFRACPVCRTPIRFMGHPNEYAHRVSCFRAWERKSQCHKWPWRLSPCRTKKPVEPCRISPHLEKIEVQLVLISCECLEHYHSYSSLQKEQWNKPQFSTGNPNLLGLTTGEGVSLDPKLEAVEYIVNLSRHQPRRHEEHWQGSLSCKPSTSKFCNQLINCWSIFSILDRARCGVVCNR